MAKKTETTALALYDEEFAAIAAQTAEQEATTGGGQKFSTQGGVLSFGGNPIPGNEVAVIVLDSVLLNTYYDQAFASDERNSPACYAIGRDEKTIAPDPEQVAEPVSDGCASCPHNQFGSADKGRGKMCANRRRLAVIPAGELADDGSFAANTDPDHYESGEVGYAELSPTALKGYATWAKGLAASRKPLFTVFAKMSLVPEKSYHKLTFTTLEPVPAELLPAVFERYKREKELIAFPFPKAESGAEPVPQARGRAPAQRAPAQRVPRTTSAPTPQRQAPAKASQPVAQRAPNVSQPSKPAPRPAQKSPAPKASVSSKF